MKRRDEAGTGVFATAIGASMFLAFLTLATHVLLNLYAVTILRSIAWDTARDLAHADARNQAQIETQARLRIATHNHASLAVDRTPDRIVVRIVARRTGLPGSFHEVATARVEKLR